MGGSSFTRPALRMSSPTLDLVTIHCITRLLPLFPQVERMHHVRSKLDHGDLDLVCGAPFEVPIRRKDVGMCGIAEGHQAGGGAEVTDSSEECGLQTSNAHHVRDGAPVAQMDAKMDAQMDNDSIKCKEFARVVAEMLGASGWVLAYYGYPLIALKIPCRLVHEKWEGHEDDFYQVDLGLVPLASFEWYRLLTSYSIPYALLVLALQTLSPALWLRRDSLTLRHAPLYNQPLLEITLSRDMAQVFNWLGLDEGRLDKWEEGFETYEEVYRWITDVKEGGVLNEAWEMVRVYGLEGMKVDWKRFHTRVDGLDGFVAWLRRTDDFPNPDESTLQSTASSSSVQPPHSMSPLPPSADPEQPTPLDRHAQSALSHFDETHTYARLLQPRQDEARAIVQRQKQRRVNQEKDKKRQEEAKERKRALAEAEAKAEAEAGTEAERGVDAEAAEMTVKSAQMAGEKDAQVEEAPAPVAESESETTCRQDTAKVGGTTNDSINEKVGEKEKDTIEISLETLLLATDTSPEEGQDASTIEEGPIVDRVGSRQSEQKVVGEGK